MSLVDNRTHLIDGENNNNVAADTTAAPTTAVSTVGTVIQGTNAIAFQVDDAQEAILFDQDTAEATFSIDMSDVTIYGMVKFGLLESFANLGGLMVLKDAADGAGGDGIGYAVFGNDVAGLPYRFGYTGFKLDVSVVVASPGTNNVDYFQYFGTEAGLDHTAIVQVGFGSFSLVKAVSSTANAWTDGFYYIANDSYAVSIQGGSSGTPEDMPDVITDDLAVGMGLFNNPKGAEYGFFGPTEWGSTAAASYFRASDQQWYLIGDNAGGHEIGATHFPFRLVGDSGNTNSFELTRLVIVNTGVRAQFDLSHADFNIVNLTQVTFDGLGEITFPANSATKDMVGLVFNNCDQVYFDTVDVLGATFNGSNDALGALLWDADSNEENQDNLTFNSDGTGHAIEIALNTAALTTFTIDGYSVSGYESANDGSTGNTVFLVDNLADGDVDINVLNGTGTFSYERAAGYTGTVTIIQSVTVRTQGVTQGTAILLQARETVGSVTAGDTLASGFADSNGLFDYSHNYEGDLDINVRANNPGHAVAAIAAATGGTVFTDETEEATDATDDDMNLLPASPAASDAFYFGHTEQFPALKLWITDANGAGSTITWEYWNGSSWGALTVNTDDTDNFENTGHGLFVEWTVPGDWATTTVTNQANTGQLYYVRARLTTVGSANQTRARRVTLNATRYLPFPQTGNAVRTIVSTGVTIDAVWVEDTNGRFKQT